MREVNIARVASLLEAHANSLKSGNSDWAEKHMNKIEEIHKNLPSGSGLDNGVVFDVNKSIPKNGGRVKQLIYRTSYHHMKDGFYDGWTQHTIILTPTFGGYAIKITGRNRNEIKEYLVDLFIEVFSLK